MPFLTSFVKVNRPSRGEFADFSSRVSVLNREPSHDPSDPKNRTTLLGCVVKVASLAVTQEVGVRVPAPQFSSARLNHSALWLVLFTTFSPPFIRFAIRAVRKLLQMGGLVHVSREILARNVNGNRAQLSFKKSNKTETTMLAIVFSRGTFIPT